MVNVLFTANAANRARVFIPIADKLVSMGHKATFVSLDKVLNGNASYVLKNSRHPFFELDFSTDEDLFSMDLHRRFETLLKIKPIAKDLLENTKPDVIILGAAAYVEGVLIELARERGIKTVLMQDGLRIEEEKNLSGRITGFAKNSIASVVNEWTLAFKGTHYFFTPFGTNRVDGILLFGSSIKERLAKQGIEEKRLFVVGNPLYDSIAPLPEDHLDDIRKYFGIQPGYPVALFGMQCFHKHLGISLDDEVAIVKDLVDLFNEIPKVHLLVKLHPDNIYEKYMRSFAEWKPQRNVSLVKDEFASAELLSLSSVFMTVYSTMALEALVHNIPVITIDYTEVKHHLNLEPAVKSVGSEEELKELFLDEKWLKMLSRKLAENKDEILDKELANLGFASEKAAEAIVKIYNS